MKKYIGTKEVMAQPMSAEEAVKMGYKVGSNTGNGYEVEYKDGYKSWSPKEVFEEAYKEFDNMSFGMAIDALKNGRAIRRRGWNGKGLFVVKQIPAHIDSTVIPKMQSLPQSAKDLILKGNGFIDYTSQCLIINENNGKADSWVPSISDVFAEDWEIVNN